MTPSEQILAKLHADIKASGMSQREISRKMGVSEARISQMLHSRTNMTLASLNSIYAALATT